MSEEFSGNIHFDIRGQPPLFLLVHPLSLIKPQKISFGNWTQSSENYLQVSALKGLCVALCRTLHERDPEMATIYEDLGSCYSENIQKVTAAVRSRDSGKTAWLLLRRTMYLYFHGLINYARLMPPHLAQMYQLKEADPTTWEVLKNDDFVVTKSMQTFCNLFTDQGLEQEIKVLKKHSAMPGITQDEVALDRFVTTTPHLAWLVQKYLLPFRKTSATQEKKEHYQLAGDICVGSSQNVLRLRVSVILHCEGNAYTVGMPLKNIFSSAVILEKAKYDILNYPTLGQELYKKFVEECLLPTSNYQFGIQ